ncbi:unnamed protein product [Caenorhabditis sp. 36 PRJEB53466]|nr:unnamed protein product [Caenorhabditis sp. 36 PRJEB53466]
MPTAIVHFVNEMSSIPSVAVAAGPALLIYKNLKPFYKIPKKTKIFIDQTSRELEFANKIHTAYQKDLFNLRFKIAEVYQQLTASASATVSTTSSLPVEIAVDIHGFGPNFRMGVHLLSSSRNNLYNLHLSIISYPELYEFDTPLIPICLLSSGQTYSFTTMVLCKDPEKAAQCEIRAVLVQAEQGSPIVTAIIKMPFTGADIKEMAKLEFPDVFQKSFFANWDALSRGGTELALMCDIVYAGENAVFGQPEVNIGTIPGLGGTQRWPRFVSKSLAMEICLTGDRMNADEAQRAGLISKIFPVSQLVQEAVRLADRIARNSPLIVGLIKKSINGAYETSLKQGLNLESQLFQSTFATNDRREGMSAFVEKRLPKWSAS